MSQELVKYFKMKFKFAFTLAAVLVCGVEFSEPLKVLGVFPTFGRSHWNVGNGLLMSLVEAGHEVTMVSAFPLKKPMKNYRDVKIEGVFELFDSEYSITLDAFYLINYIL